MAVPTQAQQEPKKTAEAKEAETFYVDAVLFDMVRRAALLVWRAD